MTPNIVDCSSALTIGSSCRTINAVSAHFYVSDNRETLPNAKICCLNVDAGFYNDVSDYGKKWCDEKSGLRACSRER